ncbi:right-handed parallel beta-helix repeat-containing protein [Myxococcota bacterium]|nr:right-handed parallel beta-helix repeat-containing protein [Myxococcota bacterium]
MRHQHLRRLLLALLLCPWGQAQATDVSGALLGDATWSPQGNPWVVTGDVHVPEGVTLTIQAGVEVRFSLVDDAGLNTARTELRVDGALSVEGAAGAPVRFTSASNTPGRGNWEGIIVGTTGAVEMAYANIAWAVRGLDFEPGEGIGLLSEVNITQCSQEGARAQDGASLDITGGVFHENGGDGVQLNDGAHAAAGAIFYHNGGSGLAALLNLNTSTFIGTRLTSLRNGYSGFHIRSDVDRVVTSLTNSISAFNARGLTAISGNFPPVSDYNLFYSNTSGDHVNGAVMGAHSFKANPLLVDHLRVEALRPTHRSPARGAASTGDDLGALDYTNDLTVGLVGVLDADMTLAAGQEHRLIGDLIVPTGVTLTLEAGARLKLGAGDLLGAGELITKTEILVRGGALISQGTAQAPVTLGGGSVPAVRGEWGGLVFEGGGPHSLAFMEISEATDALMVKRGQSLTLRDVRVERCNSHGLYALDGAVTDSARLWVRGCNGEGVTLNDGQHRLTHSQLLRNSARGVYVLAEQPDTVMILEHLSAFANGEGLRVARDHVGAQITLSDLLIFRNSSYGLIGTGQGVAVDRALVWDNANGTRDISAVITQSLWIRENPLVVDEDGDDLRLTHHSPAIGVAGDGEDLGALPFDGALSEVIFGVLREDLVLTAAGSPWRIPGDLYVPPGVTLTIEPGARVLLGPGDANEGGEDRARVEIIVDGTLQAGGEPDLPILIESGADTPGRVDWDSIRLTPQAIDCVLRDIELRNTRRGLRVETAADLLIPNLTMRTFSERAISFSGAGAYQLIGARIEGPGDYGVVIGDADYNFVADGGPVNVVIEESIITGLASYAIRIENNHPNSRATFDNLTIDDNAYGFYHNNTAVDARFLIQDSLITNHGSWGIQVAAQDPILSHNDVWNNASNTRNYTGVNPDAGSISINPLYVSDADLRLTANSPAINAAHDGGHLGALTPEGTLTEGLVGVLRQDTTLTAGAPWFIIGDLIVPEGVTLTLEPGAVLHFASSDLAAAGIDRARVEIIVEGTLIAEGTAAAPISLRSPAPTPGRSDWYGVRLQPGAVGHSLAHLTLRHARVPLTLSGAADLTIPNLHVERWSERAVSVEGEGRYTFSDARLIGPGDYGFYIGDADLNTVPDGRATQVRLLRPLITGLASYAVAAFLGRDGAWVEVDHATLYDNAYGAWGRVDHIAARFRIANSIITNNSSWGIHSSGTFPIELSHNDVWFNASNTRNYTGLTADAGSISVNPLYKDEATDDFELTQLSPCRDADENGEDMGARPYTGATFEGLVGTLVEDLTLTAAGSPWLIIGDLIVPEGRTLTIEPGARVRLGPGDAAASGEDRARTEIIVYGDLIAEGTAEARISLISANGTPARADWFGVRVEEAGLAALRFVDIEHTRFALRSRATRAQEWLGLRIEMNNERAVSLEGTGAVRLADTLILSPGTRGLSVDDRDINDQPDGTAINARLERVIISGADNYGLYLFANHPDTSLQVNHITLWNNQSGVLVRQNDAGSVINIQNSIISQNNSYGIYSDGGHQPQIRDNNIWYNYSNNRNSNINLNDTNISENPLLEDPSAGAFALTHRSPSRFRASDGGDQGAWPFVDAPTRLLAGHLHEDLTLTLAGSPYVLSGDLTVLPGRSLIIEAGVIVRASPVMDLMAGGGDRARAEIITRGALRLEGERDARVSLTSDRAIPAAGDWGGLRFTHESAGNQVAYADIRYTTRGIWHEALTPLSLYELQISHANAGGVYVAPEAGAFTLARSTISNYAGNGVELSSLEGQIYSTVFHDGVVGIRFDVDDIHARIFAVNNTLHAISSHGIDTEKTVEDAQLYLVNNLFTEIGGYAFFARSNWDPVVLHNAVLGARVYSGVDAPGVTNLALTDPPGYVNAEARDLRLTEGSAVLDRGEPTLAPARDRDGRPRSLPQAAGGEAIPDIGAYEYDYGAPLFLDLVPDRLQQGQGARLSLQGAALPDDLSVEIGGLGARVVDLTWVDDTEIWLDVEIDIEAPLGLRDLVGSYGEGQTTEGLELLTILSGPQITEITPAEITQGTAERLTVRGRAFVGGLQMTFGPGLRALTQPQIIDAGTLAITVEADEATPVGPREVTLTNLDGGAASAEGLLSVARAVPLPLLTGVDPQQGPRGARGLELVVSGQHLQPDARLTLSGPGLVMGATRFVDAQTLRVGVDIAEDAPIGRRDLSVINPDGGRASLGAAFAVTTNLTVEAVEPARVLPGDRGVVVSVSGQDFTADVRFSLSAPAPGPGIAVREVVWLGSTRALLTLDVADDAVAGWYDIIATRGAESARGEALLEVGAAGLLRVDEATPSRLPQGAQGLLLTIRGANLPPALTADLGVGVEVTEIASLSSSAIALTVNVDGAALIGPRDARLSFGEDPAAPAQTVTAPGLIEIIAGPRITGVIPDVIGQGASQRVIEVRGEGFSAGALVTLLGEGAHITEQQRIDANTLRLRLDVDVDAPLGALGLRVVALDGGRVERLDALTIQAAPVPSGLIPDRAFAGDEVRVTVNVEGVQPGATLALSGGFIVASDAVAVDGALQATLTISPQAEASARDVTVINPDGGRGALPGAFTVTPIPIALSLSPDRVQQGQVEATLTLTGRAFQEGAEAMFIEGGVQVLATRVLDARTLEIDAQVTEDATLGMQSILITNPDGGASTPVPLLRVDPAGLVRLLDVRPSALFFTAAVDREAPAPQRLDINFTAPPEGDFTATASAPWITLDLSEGQTPSALSVGVDPWLTGVDEGALNGAVIIETAGFIATLPVSLEVISGEALDEREAEAAAGGLVVTPQQIDLNIIAGQAAMPQAMQVRMGDGSHADWVALSDQAFLRISPPGGRAPTQGEVSFELDGLAPRALPYRATIRVTAPAVVAERGVEVGEREVDVRIFIRDPEATPSLVVEPAQVQLSAAIDGPPPAPVPVRVSAAPGGLFAFNAEIIEGAAWLRLTSPTGQTPGVFALSADVSGLDPEESPFRGQARVTMVGVEAPVEIPVTLYLGVPPPTADAGADMEVEPTVITLDGSGSVGVDEIVAWRWRLLEGPTEVTLLDPEAARCPVMLRTAGRYTFELIVTDVEGREGLPDRVRVEILDAPPMADAGVGLDWLLDGPSRRVQLRGGRSADANGDPLVVYWTQLAGPPVEPEAPAAADTAVEVSEPGLYRFKLEVRDPEGQSGEAVVTHVVHRAGDHTPAAYVEAITRGRVGAPARLDGLGALDSDGDGLTFVWTQREGVEIQLDDPLSATPSFPAIHSGRYAFELTVADEAHASRPALTWLLIDRPDDHVPTADAGEDMEGVVGEGVELSAAASTDSPEDPEGRRLQAAWGFSGALRAPLLTPQDAAETRFIPVMAGVYEVSLQVFDGRHISAPSRAYVVIDEVGEAGNRLPRPEGAIIEATRVGEPLRLDARGVEDPDGDALSARWRQVAGAPLALDDPEALLATGTPRAPGEYAFMLSLDDGRHRGPERRLSVIVADRDNAAPIADAGADQEARAGDEITLDGSQSFDPDEDALIYHWSLLRAPMVVALPAPGADPIARFTARVSGVYAFELRVNDGRADSAPDEVIITALSDAVEPGVDPDDLDGDGVLDDLELEWGLDPNTDDSDGDGTPDAAEIGDGEAPLDTDGDGIINALDEDDDGDGIPSLIEGQTDDDRDGIPNFLDDDDDNDGVLSVDEGAEDFDGDGLPNYLDRDDDDDGAATRIEAPRGDTDGDGAPDYMDADDDGDGVDTALEAPRGDTDGDGVPDPLDTDDDGDSVPTAEELPRGDTDQDGRPDFLDADDDGDGVSTLLEVPMGDVDEDGIEDYLDADQPGAPVEPDAGLEDAGLEDAGLEDAGLEDAGLEDAGLLPDSAAPGLDVGLERDAASVTPNGDGGGVFEPGEDAEADAEADGGAGRGVADDGCGCRAGRPSATPWFFLLLLLPLRRRRRR